MWGQWGLFKVFNGEGAEIKDIEIVLYGIVGYWPKKVFKA